MRFGAGVSLGVAGSMAARMRVYTRVLTNVGINVVSGSVGCMSRAVSEISQQGSYNKVDQPDQEASNKHK